ncbi:unnamed protein product [marine sediment metagenome]|uniref:Uncharacterized protein n=1 Tax=marine sediment metagenome TaxID=412755 RepID=X1BI66_9ZZZZ
MIRVILHHSLTKDGEVKDFDAIKKYHIEKMNMIDIGYHYVIEMVNGHHYNFLYKRHFSPIEKIIH